MHHYEDKKFQDFETTREGADVEGGTRLHLHRGVGQAAHPLQDVAGAEAEGGIDPHDWLRRPGQVPDAERSGIAQLIGAERWSSGVACAGFAFTGRSGGAIVGCGIGSHFGGWLQPVAQLAGVGAWTPAAFGCRT